MITGLGIKVHTGVGVEASSRPRRTDASKSDDDDSVRVSLNDGTAIDAGVVFFAAGVRPRDELAREIGLRWPNAAA